MLDLDATPGLRWLFRIARFRVKVGFIVAGATLWLARPSPSSLVVGALVALGGEALRVWAAGHLRKGLEVTRSGPYRYFAHPLYIGSFIIGAGFAIAVHDAVAATIVVVYLGVTLFAAVRLEEATLRDTFSDDYAAYARGRTAPSDRQFSISQLVVNGEHKALAGFIAALVALWFKASFLVS